jgi:hypothetical protein
MSFDLYKNLNGLMVFVKFFNIKRYKIDTSAELLRAYGRTVELHHKDA